MDAKLRETICPTNFFWRRECRRRSEILDLSGDLTIITGRIKKRDSINTTFTGQQVVPESIDVVSKRGHSTQPCHHHSAFSPMGHKKEKGQRSCSRELPRLKKGMLLLLAIFDVLDHIPHTLQLLRFFIRDLLSKLFLQSHHQLDCIERICSQILNK